MILEFVAFTLVVLAIPLALSMFFFGILEGRRKAISRIKRNLLIASSLASIYAFILSGFLFYLELPGDFVWERGRTAFVGATSLILYILLMMQNFRLIEKRKK